MHTWNADNSHLLRYISEIEHGNIIVGQELWLELSRLREDFHNDRYFYNTEKSNLYIEFMEHCVRLTKSPYYNKPMVLMLWQKAFIETMYSFKMAETGLERFKKILLLIARKNGKSETNSGIALTEFWLGNQGADIVCSSNDDSQASIVYDAIDLMRQLIDPHDLDSKRNQRFILNKSTNTKIFKLSDRTRNKEGRNIDFAIVDETHEMKTNVISKSIEQSQSLKDNPKFINITTEGFIFDGYLDDELRKARKIIYGEDDGISAERFLPWLYTQDTEQEVWQDRSSWVKSNPTLGVIKKWEYLDEQIDVAKKSKADRIFVLSKDFNIKQNSSESWLNFEDYSYKKAYNLEDFRGAFCLGAVDLSETTDLTCAKILMMKSNDNNKYIHTMYFIPETKLDVDNDDHSAGAKYKEWAERGYITISEGSDIDLSIVADWFYKIYKDYDIKLVYCGYDQRFSKDWLKRMDDLFSYTKGNELILINQNSQTLSNAMKMCESEFKHQRINYNLNPVDMWCLSNGAIQVDNQCRCLCVKKEANKRIDGAVTFIILYETYRRYRSEFAQYIKKQKLKGGDLK